MRWFWAVSGLFLGCETANEALQSDARVGDAQVADASPMRDAEVVDALALDGWLPDALAPDGESLCVSSCECPAGEGCEAGRCGPGLGLPCCEGCAAGERCQSLSGQRGLCPGTPCQSTADCGDDSYCETPEGACLSGGICTFKPQSCPDQAASRCGCDGRTYANDCQRAMAGVGRLHEGACGEECAVALDCLRLSWTVFCQGHWACEVGACVATCEMDTCGDGQCRPSEGESRATCFPDCGAAECATTADCASLGWSAPCEGYFQCKQGLCESRCGGHCGDGRCDAQGGEGPAGCPSDCRARCVTDGDCPGGVCLDGACYVERCGDGQDNDGDGLVDEGCLCQDDAACPAGRCVDGVCLAERCGDGLDDDLDDEVDEGCPCVTADDCAPRALGCEGEWRCLGGACAPLCPERCGDLLCEPVEAQTCREDCPVCGDGRCGAGEQGCPQDCPVCGDGRCDGDERAACPADCPVCGDGLCEPLESPASCAYDCTGDCRDGERRTWRCSADQGETACLCQSGRWRCEPSDDLSCHQPQCDDGTWPTCDAPAERCKPGELLAFQGGCVRCVQPETCLPQARCASDADCGPAEYCPPCEGEGCRPTCTRHGCDSEVTQTCAQARPSCDDGQVSVLRDGCWRCVSVALCQTEAERCEAQGGACVAASRGCPGGEAPVSACDEDAVCCASSTCLVEGEFWSLLEPAPCCRGLAPLPVAEGDPRRGDCRVSLEYAVCVACGDGTCGPGESACNCPQDCLR